MIDVNHLHKGVTFLHDGALYKVLDYHHNKPGRGNATIRVKAVNLRNGSNIEKTFQSGERIQDVRLDYHNVQYLYNDGSLFYFMDTETYDQTALPKEILGETAGFLTENLEVKLTLYEGEPIDVELPTSVDLKVTHAEIAVRGDTATGVTKKVTVETGITVQVPNFINEGDVIKVDTRNGAYLTRA